MTINMTKEELLGKIEEGISQRYTQFEGLINSEDFRPFKELCMDMASNPELLGHVKFCNDLFHIPPVKTFLLYNLEKIQTLVDDITAPLSEKEKETQERMLKRSMGAFWGAVFKGALEYQNSQTVTVSLQKPLKVSTASYFF